MAFLFEKTLINAFPFVLQKCTKLPLRQPPFPQMLQFLAILKTSSSPSNKMIGFYYFVDLSTKPRT